MNYETAFSLKEAGFPQEFGRGYKSHGKIPINATAEEMERIECYFPTLDELIDWCDDDFYFLERQDFPDEELQWRCCGYSTGEKHNEVFGSTPNTAVAKLWLALNEKKTGLSEGV